MAGANGLGHFDGRLDGTPLTRAGGELPELKRAGNMERTRRRMARVIAADVLRLLRGIRP
jgi:hypothetical protein